MFYQLRALWQLGRELIEQFVADLARQQEERERRAHFAEHNRRQFARRQAVEKPAARGGDAARLMRRDTRLPNRKHSARGSRASGTTSSGASSIIA